jgi:hypothetical protein
MILLAFFTLCCTKHCTEWPGTPENVVGPRNPVRQRGDFATIRDQFNEW